MFRLISSKNCRYGLRDVAIQINVSNEQKVVKVTKQRIVSLVRFLFRKESIQDQTISILFCDDKRMKTFHKQFMGLNTVTDVMAFPTDSQHCPDLKQYLGDVVVSAERAKIVASTYDQSVVREIDRYVVHGILHLLGYDDKTTNKKKIMTLRQEAILKQFWDSK